MTRHLNHFVLALIAGAILTPTLASDLHRVGTGDPATLDPHKIVDPWEATIVMDLFIGLTTLTPSAEVVPGSAESWTVSDDGRTYVFKLRDGLMWSDGTPLTAKDFEYSFRRILTPATASPIAARHFIIENARAINRGEMPPEALGVTALNDRELEIRLNHPAPYFPELIVHRALPAPRHAIEEHDDRWVRPENMVSNGAFVLEVWRPNDFVQLRKNANFYGADNVRLTKVFHHTGEDANRALREFRSGSVDAVVTVPTEQLEWLRENMPDSLRLFPGFGLQHLAFNTTRAPFDDVRVRQALAMAIDREVLAEKILKSGEIPAYGLVPPQAKQYPNPAKADFVALSQRERNARAKALLAEAGFPNGLTVTLSYNTNEILKRVMVAVAAMWRQVGVRTQLENSEAKVVIANMRNGNFEIGRYLWLAETSDAFSFVERIHSGAGPLNHARYSNEEFDALLDQAQLTSDLSVRADLIRRAEALALADMPVIPLYFYAGRRLVQPYVKGWVNNARGINLARDMWIDEELKP